MKISTSRILSYAGCSALLFTGCFLFLLLKYPQLLSYHEQYQLFLFTGDYFADRMALPGGFADYVSEFAVQFGYVPWMGAAVCALLLTGVQLALAACCLMPHGADVPRTVAPVTESKTGPTTGESKIGLATGKTEARGRYLRGLVYVLAAWPSLLLLHYMGDVNLLVSYPVAILIVLLCTALAARLCSRWWSMAAAVAIGFPALYWLAGPAAFIYAVLLPLLCGGVKGRWLCLLVSAVYAVCAVYVIGRLFLPQIPESQMYLGINYHRITNHHPASVFAVAGLVVAIVLLCRYASLYSGNIGAASAPAALGIVAVAAVIFVPKGYDARIMQPLRYDMLVRHERWADILNLAGKQPPTDDISLQAVNLALAKTGQLGERMFEFDQHGISSLISRYRYDNTTCLVSAEVFWHLGMVNSAFRYNFDLQEAIMNDRKSGRFLKRMAECQIVNGQYRVARKYTAMLKKSLFYSDWAKRAESFFTGDDRTPMVEAWAEKRAVRYKDEMLYYYDEIEKMFGLLALGSEGRNPLAWEYFNAALLLKGDLATMAGMYHYAPEMFRTQVIPRHHQEAIAFYWTFGHRDFTGLPYPVSEDVKQSIASLAQVYAANQTRPEVWRQQFPGHYCVFFLSQQLRGADKTETPEIKGSEREG